MGLPAHHGDASDAEVWCSERQDVSQESTGVRRARPATTCRTESSLWALVLSWRSKQRQEAIDSKGAPAQPASSARKSLASIRRLRRHVVAGARQGSGPRRGACAGRRRMWDLAYDHRVRCAPPARWLLRQSHGTPGRRSFSQPLVLDTPAPGGGWRGCQAQVG
jgi:hypothetical protein